MTMIRTANSRLRRGSLGTAEKKLTARAEQLGFTTKSGSISKSKKAASSKQLKKAFEEYEREHFEEKQDQNYQHRKDIEDLINERIPPSDWWQTMRKTRSPEAFAQSITDKISDFSIFEEEYQQEILEYCEKEWYQ